MDVFGGQMHYDSGEKVELKYNIPFFNTSVFVLIIVIEGLSWNQNCIFLSMMIILSQYDNWVYKNTLCPSVCLSILSSVCPVHFSFVYSKKFALKFWKKKIHAHSVGDSVLLSYLLFLFVKFLCGKIFLEENKN